YAAYPTPVRNAIRLPDATRVVPLLERAVGPLSKELERLSALLALVPLERALASLGAATGRPAKDRAALATAFMAKTILNLPTTRALLSRLKGDEALRQL